MQGNDGVIRPFAIVPVRTAESVFPRAHTCFNRIDLPMYESESELRRRLREVLSVDPTAGFTME